MRVAFEQPSRLWNQIPFIKLLRRFADVGTIDIHHGSLAKAKELAEGIQAGKITTLPLKEWVPEEEAQKVVAQLRELGFTCDLVREEVPFPELPPPGAGLPSFDLRLESLETQVAELKEELSARTQYLEKALDRIARLERKLEHPAPSCKGVIV